MVQLAKRRSEAVQKEQRTDLPRLAELAFAVAFLYLGKRVSHPSGSAYCSFRMEKPPTITKLQGVLFTPVLKLST
jgi:hypothetical protein